MNNMTYRCPDCGLQVEKGHRFKAHPPRTYVPAASAVPDENSAAMRHQRYLQTLKDKGYEWDEEQKRWIKRDA